MDNINEKQDKTIDSICDEMKTKVPWTIFALAMTLFIVAMGWMFIVINANNSKAEGAIERVSSVEGDLKEIKADLKWIIKSLDSKNTKSDIPTI